jgi:hypothetical protein
MLALRDQATWSIGATVLASAAIAGDIAGEVAKSAAQIARASVVNVRFICLILRIL